MTRGQDIQYLRYVMRGSSSDSLRVTLALMLLTGLILPVSAMTNSSLSEDDNYWIKIDPVLPCYIGETVNITGTTNLPEKEKIWVTGIAGQVYNYQLTHGERDFEQYYNEIGRRPGFSFDRECMINTSTKIKEFFCLINTSEKSPEIFYFTVSSQNITANSTLLIKNRWMAFDPFERNVTVGDLFSLIGTTNAPVGARLDLVIFGENSNFMNPAGFPCSHCITLNTTVMKSDRSPDIGTFAFTVNTSDLNPGENEIWLYETDEFWGTGFNDSSILVNPSPPSDLQNGSENIAQVWINGLCACIVVAVCIYILHRKKIGNP